MLAALHSYTHPNWLRFWGSGSLMESKKFHDVMIEANSHLKLHPTSILDICWLPYLQNNFTGNTPYGTGNATHTGNVIFKRYVTGTSAAIAGSPYPQKYFTGIAPKYNVQYR